jgi:hypothetical protein
MSNLNSGFLLLYDWLPALESLSGDEYKELVSALIRYQRDGTELPPFENPIVNVFAAMIAPTIQRRLNGQKGGKNEVMRSRDCITSGDTIEASKAEISRDKHTLSDESDKRARTRARKFDPPTVEDVRTYCEERKNTVDAEKFVDHYTANGWRVGRNQMQDWKAAVRKWEKSEGAFAHGEGDNGVSAKGHGSFDTDDFFESAVQNTYDALRRDA